MLCYNSKYSDNAMGQFLQFGKYKGGGDRTMLCNIEKDYGKATGNALLIWKRLLQGDGTMNCDIVKYACIMAMRLDNAVQY